MNKTIRKSLSIIFLIVSITTALAENLKVTTVRDGNSPVSVEEDEWVYGIYNESRNDLSIIFESANPAVGIACVVGLGSKFHIASLEELDGDVRDADAVFIDNFYCNEFLRVKSPVFRIVVELVLVEEISPELPIVKVVPFAGREQARIGLIALLDFRTATFANGPTFAGGFATEAILGDGILGEFGCAGHIPTPIGGVVAAGHAECR